MLEFQSLWVWSWIQRQFDWQYYVYLKFDFLRDNKSVFYYLPIREGHPAYLPSPSSQLTSQPPPWSLHSHPEFYLLGSQALRRTHQFKLCFWALPSKELLTLWTQHCNSLFMTSTNPVTETYKWIRHPILCRYKYVSPCLLRMLCHTQWTVEYLLDL